jgi:UDP-N-acetylglucosamine 1-carboxyvinyltransferase
MFESRLFFDKLIDMGAKSCCVIHIGAVVMGHNQSQLKATTMSSPDIRAGISH